MDADQEVTTGTEDARQLLMSFLIPAAEEPKEQHHKQHLEKVLSDILLGLGKVSYSRGNADAG